MRRFRLKYYIREAFLSLRRSGTMAWVSSAVTAVAVLAMGAYWIGYQNTEALMDRLGGRIEVVVFFDEGLSMNEVDEAAIKLRKIAGARMVTLISPDAALEELQKDRELKKYLELLEDNPLPASARVILEQQTPELMRAFAARAGEVEGVDTVDYGDQAAEAFLNTIRAVRWLILIVGAVLCSAALLIVSNVIRLTVFARREEISIMQLVGASKLFVRAPYVMEGCLTGLIGGSAAAGALYAMGTAMSLHLKESLNVDTSQFIVVGVDSTVLGAMVLLGVGLGFLGSLAAVGRYLK